MPETLPAGPLKAPFPWFGGKTRAAPLIWQLLGEVPNFVDPFMGSLAVPLLRPHPPGIETFNDRDPYLCNAWRALVADPAAVAHWAAWPVNESDLHARHAWLKARREVLRAQVEGDPDYYDAKLAGWWLWGISLWIGGGWCGPYGDGPWQVVAGDDGTTQLQYRPGAEPGICRQRPHLAHAGQGVYRKRPHLGGETAGVGVTAKTLRGPFTDHQAALQAWFVALQTRLARARVCCGDWTRVCGESVTVHHGTTGLVLDPPYAASEGRTMDLYAEDSGTVALDVQRWCLDHGQHPLLRIVLCGYDTTHDVLLAHGWRKYAWRTAGGYGTHGNGQGRANVTREQIWASPACLRMEQLSLFGEGTRDGVGA